MSVLLNEEQDEADDTDYTARRRDGDSEPNAHALRRLRTTATETVATPRMQGPDGGMRLQRQG